MLKSIAVTLHPEKREAVVIECCPVPHPAMSISGEEACLIMFDCRRRLKSSTTADIDFIFVGRASFTQRGYGFSSY